MEATSSPRRILGDRNVNKPVIKSPSIMKTSPLKPSPFPNKAGMRSNGLEVAHLAKTSISVKSGVAEGSTIPIGSKRGIVCLEDVPEGPSQKQLINKSVEVDCMPVGAKTRYFTPFTIAIDNDVRDRVERTTKEVEQSIRKSPSSDSFNTTEDYWNEDSQNTTLTEPDIAPQNISVLTAAHSLVRRTISPQEARDNAEALRLRLKVAMYKIKTNQTDLPLSQVQIRPSHSVSNAVSILPPYPHPQPKHKAWKPLPAGSSILTHTGIFNHDSIGISVRTAQSPPRREMSSTPEEVKGPSVAQQDAGLAISPARQPAAKKDHEEYLAKPNSAPSRIAAYDPLHTNREVEEGELEDKKSQDAKMTKVVVQGSAAEHLLSLSARATLDLMGCN